MTTERERLPIVVCLILVLAVALRLIGIGYGLPAVFNSDEPHLVNVAVSFGGGSLNPHLFKYPTLWMYVLFAAYGVYFAFWSGLGQLHSAADFGRYFVWNPTPFFLIGRLLAAGFSAAALIPVYRTGRRWLGTSAAAAAALLLAVSPGAVKVAHSTKPESLLFFFSALAWAFAARYLDEGRRRDLLLAAAAAGCAFSSQYTAALLGVLLVSTWVARRVKEGAAPADLPLACVVMGAAFVAGSPFVAVDFHEFWSTVRDIGRFESVLGTPAGLRVVAANVYNFAGFWLGGLSLLAGTIVTLRRDKVRACWLLAPVLAYLLVLARSSEGGWDRYLMAVYPALALLAAAAVDACEASGGRSAAFAVTLLAAAPGVWGSATYDREILLPDTRTLSADWIEANVPQGKTLLLDQEHASPRVAMSKATAARLLEQTRKEGHPRAKYYQYLLDGHPGGGYGVYRVLRDYKDLHTHEEHASYSAKGQPMLDVRPGLAAAKAAGVDYVVLTDFGADPSRSPELVPFLGQVRKEGARVADFAPQAGRIEGPRIEIYRLR